jgi:tRNA (mo5U34)-methyltransferase
LVVEGDQDTVLEPNGRYARMGNVWHLPSPDLARRWMSEVGLIDATVVDVGATSVAEQRSTEWMTFHSLSDFLDPQDPRLTVEGYPAPRRAILTARAPR